MHRERFETGNENGSNPFEKRIETVDNARWFKGELKTTTTKRSICLSVSLERAWDVRLATVIHTHLIGQGFGHGTRPPEAGVQVAIGEQWGALGGGEGASLQYSQSYNISSVQQVHKEEGRGEEGEQGGGRGGRRKGRKGFGAARERRAGLPYLASPYITLPCTLNPYTPPVWSR